MPKKNTDKKPEKEIKRVPIFRDALQEYIDVVAERISSNMPDIRMVAMQMIPPYPLITFNNMTETYHLSTLGLLEVTSLAQLKADRDEIEFWSPTQVERIDYLAVSYYDLHIQYLRMQTNLLSFINMRNMNLLGYGELDLEYYILHWAKTRAGIARRIRKRFNEPYSELFTAGECRPDHHDRDKDDDSIYSRPPSKEELDSLVERGLLGCYAEHYFITEAGINALGIDAIKWENYQPHIEAALEKLQRDVFFAEVLEEALSILEMPQEPEPSADNTFQIGQRVYLPYCDEYGEVRRVIGNQTDVIAGESHLHSDMAAPR